MKILHSVTYTQLNDYDKSLVERATQIIRPYKLTHQGCERILRRVHSAKNLYVSRVETMIDER